MIYSLIQRSPKLKQQYVSRMRHWGEKKIRHILPHLKKKDSIIDIGSGNCLVCSILSSSGYAIVPLDIANLSLVEDQQPVIYDGKKIPFEENSFDVSLLLTVLHHCKNPVEVLKEAFRVSQKVIIIEDTYRNSIQKWMTQKMDWIINEGHSEMTYQNRSHAEWLSIFKELGLKVNHFEHKRVLLFFQQTTYILN